MKKAILVTTDFSQNSKAGIRFAIQLASQSGAPLIFLHIIQLLIPTRWNDVKAKIVVDEELEATEEQLRLFVKGVYKEERVRAGKFDCAVRYGSPVDRAIIDYAIERKVSFICIGTRGAGVVRRIVGTHTSSLIKRAPVPVFAVPGNYKRSPIKTLMYASDLDSLKWELNKVQRLAESVKAKIDVVHYEDFVKITETRSVFEKASDRYSSGKVAFYLQKFNWEESLARHLKRAISKFRPSVVVLFSKQDRTWYERIFFSSKSASLSYDTRKPILVYPKRPV